MSALSKNIILLVILFMASTQVRAGILLEPYMGFGSVKTIEDYGSDDTDTTTGVSLGGRAGYEFLLFAGGIDIQNQTAGDYSANNTSVFAQFSLPILLKAWAEYFVSSDFDNGTSREFDFDSGYGVGVGFTGLPFVSLNLEVQNLTYKTEFNGSDERYESIAYLVSVSLPLNF